MLFKKDQVDYFVNKMHFRIDEVESQATAVCGSNAKSLVNIVDFIMNQIQWNELQNKDCIESSVPFEKFHNGLFEFVNSLGYDSESPVYDYSNDLYILFFRFNNGGLRELLKEYSPDAGEPRVYLSECISTETELACLPDNITIYRGMSLDEFNSKKFGQAWSLNIEVAKRFAKESYNNKNNKGVLVKAVANKSHVFYYDKLNRNEDEVVMDSNFIKCPKSINYNESV